MYTLNHYSFESVPTVYDEEALTVLELCSRLGAKINELIKGHNDQDELIKALYSTELTKQVAEWLEAHPEVTTTVQDGELTLAKFMTGALGFVTPQLFGARGDGLTDDTQAIVDAIACLGDKCSTLYFPAGTYLVSEDISIPGNVLVYGDGDVSAIRRKANNLTEYNVFLCEDVENVIFRNIRVIGDRTDHDGTVGEWGHGITLWGTHHVTIENCTLCNCWGDGIYVGSSKANGRACTETTIKNCTIDNNRRNGVSVIHCDGFYLFDTTIMNTNGTKPQSGIDFEPNELDEFIRRAFVDGCTIKDNATVGINWYDRNGAECTITNCRIYGNHGIVYNTEEPTEKLEGKVIMQNCHIETAQNCLHFDRKHINSVPFIVMGCTLSSPLPIVQFGSGTINFPHNMGEFHMLDCYVLRSEHSTGWFRYQNADTTQPMKKVTLDVRLAPGVVPIVYSTISYNELDANIKCDVVTLTANTTMTNQTTRTNIEVDTASAPVTLTLSHNIPYGVPITIKKVGEGGNAVTVITSTQNLPQLGHADRFSFGTIQDSVTLTHMANGSWHILDNTVKGVTYTA